ncbi:Nuclear lamin L1 alpha, partial [Operophtera brumata]
FKKLAPACSVEKRAGGIPQLAPQEKQLGILKYELKETLLCINELAMIENASNRLRRMENRLDLATKRFCLEYLMDIFEIAAVAFGARDECCRKLEVVQWKGLFQLNRDISEMQSYEGELNHLAKLEEFLRVKGSRRICEADEKEEMKRQEEIQRCEQEIARHDALLDEIFAYFGSDRIASIISRFQKMEIENFSCFVLLCEVLQESIVLRRDVELLRQRIR